jgi:hypothetical protein
MDLVWLCPTEGNASVIELIGGGVRASRSPRENALESLKQPGFHHVCLQVNDIEQVVSDLRHRDVKIVIDVIAGALAAASKKEPSLPIRGTISSNC